MKLKFSVSLLFASSLLLFTGCGEEIFTGKREARGVWMSRFEYTNEQTRNNPEAAKAKIRMVLEKARAARFNMIFFQIRGNGDAYYRSDFEPWAESLTGILGRDPGWDPLGFATEEAHRLGLELHAWVNAFPIWRGTRPPTESTPRSVMLAHPEWLVCDKDGKPIEVDPPNNNYVWISPGNPAARQHVVNVVNNIVERYDVDGIHFDYIRYPEGSPVKGYSHDSVSVARFNSAEANPYKLSWDHWQREQVNQFVFDAYNSITARKSWIKVSASVIGKYTGGGWTAYSVVYQDPRRWMEVGKIDFIVPMVYWERSHPTHPFVPLITEWQDRVAYDRQVLPGLASRLIEKYGWDEIAAEIREVRKKGLPGVVFFSAAGLNTIWETLGLKSFPYWSNVPRMAWKDSIPPAPPTSLESQQEGTKIVLRWTDSTGEDQVFFNIYRSRSLPIAQTDVKNLLFITGRNVYQFVDEHPFEGENYYAVSALDRLSNESRLSQIVRVTPAKLAAAAHESKDLSTP